MPSAPRAGWQGNPISAARAGLLAERALGQAGEAPARGAAESVILPDLIVERERDHLAIEHALQGGNRAAHVPWRIEDVAHEDARVRLRRGAEGERAQRAEAQAIDLAADRDDAGLAAEDEHVRSFAILDLRHDEAHEVSVGLEAEALPRSKPRGKVAEAPRRAPVGSVESWLTRYPRRESARRSESCKENLPWEREVPKTPSTGQSWRST